MVLGPTQRLDPLVVGGAGLIDVTRDRGRPHEADRLDRRVDQQLIHRGLIALEHIKDTRRQAGLGPQLGDPQRCRGILLAGFEHHGVARGDRDREEPHRHHRREVERGDDPHRAQRLANRIHVDLGGGVLGVAALEQVRHPAGELDHLLAAADLPQRIGNHLAVLGGDDLGQLTLAGIEQLAEVEQDRPALGQRGITPRGECRRGRVDHGAGILHTGQRHLTSHLTSRRIRHRGSGGRGAGVELVVDPMSDCVGSHCFSHFLYLLTKSVMVFSW